MGKSRRLLRWGAGEHCCRYATCVEPRDTKIREMSLRIQLSGFGGQDNRKRVCGLLDRLCVA
ncbi:hypothetical protein DN523_19675 [Burkholderia multivorans]|nr:hypothetical protein DN470_12110 [Burkholderia multivorans]RAA27932.1 hypothetical protein DN465_26800 [Burkholderia multivorans]RAA29478.1 hypothetical protein DN471_09065 [Burkholderia multivorans]RAA45568.1 hypothetical protein DN472_12550 [Burkholderia multivorans]RAA49137.1 hypothetical protein DN500_05945 [Burkholderia multivorans]